MRSQIELRDGWLVRELPAPPHDIPELTRQAKDPGQEWLAAAMPAQVHDVLLAHGRIPDPRIGREAAESAWVGERDWAYACLFSVPERAAGPIRLHFEGIDTLATLYVNGTKLARLNDMYRRYTVDVSGALLPGSAANVILLVFDAPLRFVQRVEERPNVLKGVPAFHFLRKCHSDFGSYLGARPHSVKVGVFDRVVLDTPDRSWIESAWVRPVLGEDLQEGSITAAVETGGVPASLVWELTDPNGQCVASGRLPTAETVHIGVARPQLWWPCSHGDQPLYRLRVQLVEGDDTLDGETVAFGFRRLEHVDKDPASGEKRFAFRINGRMVFLRGACWAPVEGMSHCWSSARADRLLDLFQQANMNVLRVWGEGVIPPESFYDACDRRGILVWQDFMFGYGMHPLAESGFAELCRDEIADMVRRLRNHSCILLWCGGNENHMGWDFRFGTDAPSAGSLFTDLMPEICAELDPGRRFHPSSPYGGSPPNWPLEGDWHDYSTLKFCPQASVPLYASEVGRASPPNLTSMRKFLADDAIWPPGHDPLIRSPGRPAWPQDWQYRSVGGSWDKTAAIGGFCDPASAEDLIRALGIAHGEYLQRRVERHRRGTPDGAPCESRRCWGTMVWRLNDAWPIIYWSVVDYYLEPKIPYYYLKRAYTPVLVSFERTADAIHVWVVNDSPEPVRGELQLQHMGFRGRILGMLNEMVEVRPSCSRRCLDASPLGPIRLRDELLRATFAGVETTFLLIGERYLHLPSATLGVTVSDNSVSVSTDDFARQVCLSVPDGQSVSFDDNWFDLPPGSQRTIGLRHSGPTPPVVRAQALNASV